MRASYRWLKELSGVDADVADIAEKLTSVGLEVEELHAFRVAERVVVGEIRKREKHPNKDRLSIVSVFDGEQVWEVICGAPNVPEPGGKILFAQLGACLDTDEGVLEIAERKIAGVISRGMICSESELHIGQGGDGIFVFGDDAPSAGTSLAEALPVGDTVLEIGLTPNRPDCLGHIGLAREIAAVYGQPFSLPEVGGPAAYVDIQPSTQDAFSLPWSFRGREVALDSEAVTLGVSIADADRCPRYGAAVVAGVTVKPSPFWLRYRLHVLGLRSLNNLVDATNLVMLEWGHPIHGFDRRRLRGQHIEVRLARAGEKLQTLDGAERELTADDLLICDGQGPIAVAGVMGGANSEINDQTTEVAIECAYFAPRSVRRTSRRLGLHTDASHRFERGVDPNAVPQVLARASALMAQLGGGIACLHGIDAHPSPTKPMEVGLRRSKLNTLLGYEVPERVPGQVLTSLGCGVKEDAVALTVKTPSWRPDLTREVDLIEEVARIHGYEHVPTVVPRVSPSRAGTPERIQLQRRVREAACAAGLHEVITYAFVSPDDLEWAGVSPKSVAVHNPLSADRSVMRTSLLPGLLRSALISLRRQVPRVGIFEFGTVFGPNDDLLPDERAQLAVLMAGGTRDWLGEGREVDFYDLKGAVGAVGAWLGVEFDVVPAATPNLSLHPRRQATVELNGRVVGCLGELHPEIADRFEFDTRAQFAELDLGMFMGAQTAQGVRLATAPPKFPAVSRDLALVVAEEHSAAEIADALRHGAGPLLESVEVFDQYRGKGVAEGAKSLAFHLVYRDRERTLTDKVVDKAHASAAKAAKTQFNAQLR